MTTLVGNNSQVPPQALAAHTAWVKGQKEVVVLMLLTMDQDIQQNLAHLGAYDMLQELKAMYSKQAEQELLQTVREFHTCKHEEGQSVSSHVLKMKGYIDNLERLGQPVGKNLGVSRILVSLNKDFDSFVQNYNMHGMGNTMNELHAMLKLHEESLSNKDANPVLHTPPSPKKDNPAKDAIYHQCGEVGHWRRNCHVYLAKLMKKKKLSQGASTSGIFTIELNSFPSKSWIYDTGCGTHICITTQGLRRSKNLKPGVLSLYVGDDHRAVVEAIGTYHLELPISKNNLVYFMAVPQDGIYEIDMSCSNTNDSSMYAITNKRAKINLDYSHLWHCHLGHITKKRIEKLQHDGLLNSIDIESLGKCVSFMSGKMARKPYSHQVERAKDLLGLIHTDVFQKEVENQLGKTIKSLHSNREGEYMSHEFLDHLKEHEIIAHRTPPYTPQNNRVSERRNQTLLDMVRSMMSQTTLPKSFWDYAHETAARILNIVPTKKVDKTPYEIWHGPSENKVFVTRNFELFESKLLDMKASGSVEDLELIQKEDTNPSVDTSLNHEEDDQEIDEPQSDINHIRKSSRTRHAPDRMCLYIDAKEHELGDLDEPANYKAALLDPESKKWLDAMNVERQSMKDNDVCVLVELPPNARTVGSKWFFKKKTNMDGAIYIFKAHLVATGFTQTYGVDYEETFSPVVDIRAIRILIVIAAYYDYEIWQMGVKTAFLNGHLFEEVYMEQPEGFVNPKYPNHVCKLKRSIYGLKQASRQWNKRFDDEIKKFDFTQNPDEPCVYLKASGSYIDVLILYVDDILLMGNNIPMLQDVKSYLGRSFAMKNLHIFLGSRSTVIGSIMYAVRCTRPDVAFAQNMTSRFQQNPGEEHWTAVKNILKYLHNTKDMFLTGYVFVLNGGAVDWKSTKQSIFATSSVDAKYIAAFDASKEAVWIRKFIYGLGIVPTIEEPINDNLADPFTKALAFPKHSELTRNIGLLPASSFMSRLAYEQFAAFLANDTLRKADEILGPENKDLHAIFERLITRKPVVIIEQLDIARKITSIALSTRVSSLKSETSILLQDIAAHDDVIIDL
nr:hypothetical protein [Tanacetum cinerariifolium]